MNGCMLLVLLALAAQVGPGSPAGQLPMEDTVSFRSTEYGWKINAETQELEYIVQISPEKANYMLQKDKEFASEIHPEVAVRIRKIVVRIGTEPIDSLPLSEVRRLPPVAAPLETNVQSEVGKGRFAQLESGLPPEIKNVAGGTPPPSLPTGGLATQLSDSPTGRTDTVSSLLDNAADMLKNPDSLLAQNAGSAFLDGTRGAVPNSSAGSKFSNTATTPPAAPPNIGTPTGLPPTSNTFPASTSGNGFPNLPPTGSSTSTALNQPGFNQPTVPPSSIPSNGTVGLQPNLPGAATTPGYGTNPAPSYNTANNYNTTSNAGGNFGAPPRGSAMQPFNNSPYANAGTAGNYPTTPLGAGTYPQNSGVSPYVQHTDPPSYGPVNRIADNRTLPTTSGNTASNMATSSYGTGGTLAGSASDQHSIDPRAGTTANLNRNAGQTYNYGQTGANEYPRTGMENIVPVMFVLSLVVNFYLGMLIRKLLGRYRTLLASVRSQTV